MRRAVGDRRPLGAVKWGRELGRSRAPRAIERTHFVMKRLAILVMALTVTAVTALTTLTTVADAQEFSLQGKTISLIISSSPGGGTDTTARLIGNTLIKHLPGAPAITFRNLPSGGGLQANNLFASRTAPDGLTLLGGSRTDISPNKVRVGQSKYDPTKYEFIGGDASLGTLLLIRKEALPRLTDPNAKPVVYGDIDGTRSGLLASLWAKEFLGWNLRWVVGYSGTSAMLLALRGGELDLAANQNAFHLTPMLQSGEFVGVAQLGIFDDSGKQVPRSAYGGAPLLEDLVLPKLDTRQRAIFNSMQADFTTNKWMALPPGTPAHIVASYRAAYGKAVKDPEFLARVTKEIGEDFAPLSGERMKAIVTALAATSDADLEYLAQLRKKYSLPVD